MVENDETGERGKQYIIYIVINSREEIDDSAGPRGRVYVKFAVNERRRRFSLSIFQIALCKWHFFPLYPFVPNI